MKTLLSILVVLAIAGLLPFGLIALARSRPSSAPPIHPIQDMFRQPKFRPQRENAMFADGRAMRPLAANVEATTDLLVSDKLTPKDAADDQRIRQGTEQPADGKTRFVARIPLPVTMELVERGRERFDIYCAACHGYGGYGDGTVSRRAAEMQTAGSADAAGWVAPTNYHSDDLRGRPVGHLYNTIANGIRTMPAYGKQISIVDRWAIVAYVKALQRSQNAKAEDVPENQRAKFQK